MTEEKKGFKRTEVGLIPEDWRVYTFADLFDFLKTGSLSRRYLNNEGDTYYIHYGDIHAKWKRILDFDNAVVSKVDDEKVKGLPTLEEGDLIIADASEDYEGVGASVEVKNLNGKRAVSGLHTILLRGKKDLIVDGLKAYLTHIESVRDRLKQVSTGTTVYGISKSKLKDVQIPLPPTLSEQQAIATALSDVDELIRSLDRLIEKKEAIKKGTMQQLLTPNKSGQASKKRLPGFDGEWEVKKIGDVVSISTGARNTEDKVKDGKYPFFVRSSKEERINTYSFDGEAVLTAGDGVGTGKIFHYINGKFDYHQRVYKMSDFTSEVDGYYFYLYFSTHFYDRVMGMTAKSSVDSVRMDMIAEMNIDLPPLKEQKAIAQILSDMDRELKTLRQKREKYKQIKQGMMQELLTGKTRLV